ncbi:MAG: hypothetical protein EU548_07325 [Promethearchaeota archaeon]|nr:MAG: hypothetical protein EU548_07325 [Candidatus Lokiarchaeota archaeon]
MTIISHKHKFIFIKTRRTAGTSIQILLEKHCGKYDLTTPIGNVLSKDGMEYNKRVRNNGKYENVIYLICCNLYLFFKTIKSRDYLKTIRNYLSVFKKKNLKNLYRNYHGLFSKLRTHMSAENIKYKVGKFIWDNYFKFAFDRNPWDKLLSKYYYHEVKQDFNKWIKYLKKENQPINFNLYSIKGKVAVDFLGRFENLQEDLKYVFDKLNLPYKRPPHEHKSRGKDKKEFRRFYSEESKRLVEKRHKKEIELFGYEF